MPALLDPAALAPEVTAPEPMPEPPVAPDETPLQKAMKDPEWNNLLPVDRRKAVAALLPKDPDFLTLNSQDQQKAINTLQSSYKDVSPNPGSIDPSVYKKYLGMPYRMGGDCSNGDVDCSSLTQHIYGAGGVSLPRTAHDQFRSSLGQQVPTDQLQPGDQVFFKGTSGHVPATDMSHTGMIVSIDSNGNPMMLAAGKGGVGVTNLNKYRYPVAAAKRYDNVGFQPTAPIPTDASGKPVSQASVQRFVAGAVIPQTIGMVSQALNNMETGGDNAPPPMIMPNPDGTVGTTQKFSPAYLNSVMDEKLKDNPEGVIADTLSNVTLATTQAKREAILKASKFTPVMQAAIMLRAYQTAPQGAMPGNNVALQRPLQQNEINPSVVPALNQLGSSGAVAQSQVIQNRAARAAQIKAAAQSVSAPRQMGPDMVTPPPTSDQMALATSEIGRSLASKVNGAPAEDQGMSFMSSVFPNFTQALSENKSFGGKLGSAIWGMADPGQLIATGPAMMLGAPSAAVGTLSKLGVKGLLGTAAAQSGALATPALLASFASAPLAEGSQQIAQGNYVDGLETLGIGATLLMGSHLVKGVAGKIEARMLDRLPDIANGTIKPSAALKDVLATRYPNFFTKDVMADPQAFQEASSIASMGILKNQGYVVNPRSPVIANEDGSYTANYVNPKTGNSKSVKFSSNPPAQEPTAPSSTIGRVAPVGVSSDIPALQRNQAIRGAFNNIETPTPEGMRAISANSGETNLRGAAGNATGGFVTDSQGRTLPANPDSVIRNPNAVEPYITDAEGKIYPAPKGPSSPSTLDEWFANLARKARAGESSPAETGQPETPAYVAPEEKTVTPEDIHRVLANGPMNADQIANALGTSPRSVNGPLMLESIAGNVKSHPGGMYSSVHSSVADVKPIIETPKEPAKKPERVPEPKAAVPEPELPTTEGAKGAPEPTEANWIGRYGKQIDEYAYANLPKDPTFATNDKWIDGHHEINKVARSRAHDLWEATNYLDPIRDSSTEGRSFSDGTEVNYESARAKLRSEYEQDVPLREVWDAYRAGTDYIYDESILNQKKFVDKLRDEFNSGNATEHTPDANNVVPDSPKSEPASAPEPAVQEPEVITRRAEVGDIVRDRKGDMYQVRDILPDGTYRTEALTGRFKGEKAKVADSTVNGRWENLGNSIDNLLHANKKAMGDIPNRANDILSAGGELAGRLIYHGALLISKGIVEFGKWVAEMKRQFPDTEFTGHDLEKTWREAKSMVDSRDFKEHVGPASRTPEEIRRDITEFYAKKHGRNLTPEQEKMKQSAIKKQINEAVPVPEELKKATSKDEAMRIIKDKYSKIEDKQGEPLTLPQSIRMQSEIRALDRIFPEGKTKAQHIQNIAGDVAGFYKTWATAFNIHAAGRQMAFLAPLNFKEYARAVDASIRSLGPDKAYEALVKARRDSPYYQLGQDAGLFSGHDALEKMLPAGGEETLTSRTARSIPVVKQSSRSFEMGIDMQRQLVFDKIVNQFKKAGITPEKDFKVYKDLADFINKASGRGKLGKLEGSKLVRDLFFSARFTSSRLALLNPAYYNSLSPPVKAVAVKNAVAYLATATTVLATMKALTGGSIETDARSNNFGLLKVGNTYIDMLGGFRTYVPFLAQLITGDKKRSSGEIAPIDRSAIGARGITTANFLYNKMAPVPRAATDMVSSLRTGKSAAGFPESPAQVAVTPNIPIYIKDVKEALQDPSNGGRWLGVAAGLFGGGVQNRER